MFLNFEFRIMIEFRPILCYSITAIASLVVDVSANKGKMINCLYLDELYLMIIVRITSIVFETINFSIVLF